MANGVVNLFTIPSNDQSIYFLGRLFGDVGAVLASNNANPFMGALFQTINTIALTVGAIIVVYTTVVGLMMTAHEGEFLGKKWSGLWVPIRMVLGVASLFPASSGYSLIQIVIMWIIIQGVGAADTLWTRAVQFNGTLATSSTPTPPPPIGVETTMEGLYKGLVCHQTYKMNPGVLWADLNNKPSDIKLKGLKYGDASLGDNDSELKMGPNGTCGTLKKCDYDDICSSSYDDSIPCRVCKAQTAQLKENIKQLQELAINFVNSDRDYLIFYYSVKQVPIVLSQFYPSAKPADWILNYCKGIGLSPENCCRATSESAASGCAGSKDLPKPYQETETSPAIPIYTNMSVEEGEFIRENNPSVLPSLTDDGKPTNFIEINAQAYNAAMNKALQEASSYVQGKMSSGYDTDYDSDKQNNYVTTAVEQGWIMAGAYFYRVAQAAAKLNELASPPLTVTDPTTEALTGAARSNYLAANDLLAVVESGGSSGSSGGSGTKSKTFNVSTSNITGKSATLVSPLKGASGTLTRTFMLMIEGKGAVHEGVHDSALLRVATFGQNLLVIAQLLYVALIGTAVLASGIAGATTIIAIAAGFGGGGVASGVEAVRTAMTFLTPALFVFLSALVSMGALLGMYVPMIPYVVFTVSAIGWFIAVIEAMVAAPIVALGILSPGGQSEVFGRAEPSVMIIFNLFLRPTLMVFGLLMAFFLADVVINLINTGFSFIMWDVMTMSPGLVEELIFIAIYASLVMTAVNQIFTLIHHIPERVLTYIGGQAMQYGEGQATQATKGAVEGAAKGVSGLSEGAYKGTRKAEQKADDIEQDVKNKSGKGGGSATLG